jgi:hypothetical protein
MTLYDTYLRSPEEALEQAFATSKCIDKETIFAWVSYLGTDRQTRYGRYRYLPRKELEGRKYNIEYWDGKVSIYFTDQLFDPITNKHIQLNED